MRRIFPLLMVEFDVISRVGFVDSRVVIVSLWMPINQVENTVSPAKKYMVCPMVRNRDKG
jgi:hypothetical protein